MSRLSLNDLNLNWPDLKRLLHDPAYSRISAHMHREIRLRIQELLNEKRPGTPNAELAKALDVHETTVKHYIEDRWTSIDRNTLERLSDFLKCGTEELFETGLSPFWETFSKKGICHYAGIVKQGPPNLEFRDDKALRTINSLVKDCAPQTKVLPTRIETADQFAGHANDNCVVVGAPRGNPVSEFALSEMFKVHPDNPQTIAPFQFVWHPSMESREGLFERKADTGERCGIWLRDQNVTVAADYNPNPDSYEASRIKEGRDCAVVCVMNRGSSSDPRKLIVLAGFTEIGTDGAAIWLERDFREFEPREGNQLVWGVLEVVYKKEAGSRNRDVVIADWRYRSGGRLPIRFKEEPIKVRGGLRIVRAKSG